MRVFNLFQRTRNTHGLLPAISDSETMATDRRTSSDVFRLTVEYVGLHNNDFKAQGPYSRVGHNTL